MAIRIENGMKTYGMGDEPLHIFGLPFYYENGRLERLPDWLRAELPKLDFLGRRTAGARVCFRTDATTFTVRMVLETLTPDLGMSLFAGRSAAVLIGDRKSFRFAGLAAPRDYETKEAEAKFTKEPGMQDVTIFLPRNDIVASLEVSFPEDATVLAPTPYDYGPVLFYGSSITEGGCACNLFNTYNGLLSNRLNMDYYNFGFAGSCKGELALADYFNTIPMKVFVYDYDENAPSVEHLQSTHEPFFRRIREKNPDLPIIMMSRPKSTFNDYFRALRDVVKTTYENALAAGDRNVYFVDGETMFGDTDRECCTIDNVHPNDLGFYRMAAALEPVLKKALGITE